MSDRVTKSERDQRFNRAAWGEPYRQVLDWLREAHEECDQLERERDQARIDLDAWKKKALELVRGES